MVGTSSLYDTSHSLSCRLSLRVFAFCVAVESRSDPCSFVFGDGRERGGSFRILRPRGIRPMTASFPPLNVRLAAGRVRRPRRFRSLPVSHGAFHARPCPLPLRQAFAGCGRLLVFRLFRFPRGIGHEREPVVRVVVAGVAVRVHVGEVVGVVRVRRTLPPIVVVETRRPAAVWISLPSDGSGEHAYRLG